MPIKKELCMYLTLIIAALMLFLVVDELVLHSSIYRAIILGITGAAISEWLLFAWQHRRMRKGKGATSTNAHVTADAAANADANAQTYRRAGADAQASEHVTQKPVVAATSAAESQTAAQEAAQKSAQEETEKAAQEAAQAPQAPQASTSQAPQTPQTPQALQTPAQDKKEAPAHEQSDAFNLDDFSEVLCESEDPLTLLRIFVTSIEEKDHERMAKAPASTGQDDAARAQQTNQKAQAPAEPSQESSREPVAIERFAAHMLRHSALFDNTVTLPDLVFVRLNATGFFYIRSKQQAFAPEAKQYILRIEQALNAIVLIDQKLHEPQVKDADASTNSMDACGLTNEEAYSYLQDYATNILALEKKLRASADARANTSADTSANADARTDSTTNASEWAVRHFISYALETLALPIRLEANWRVNVAAGNIGLTFEAPTQSLFPPFLTINKQLVKATPEMLNMCASAYTLRLGVLLASICFDASPQIQHVWIAAERKVHMQTQTLLSVDFDRARFENAYREDTSDLVGFYRAFVPSYSLENCSLQPTSPLFSLDEARFCPEARYGSMYDSTKKLNTAQAHALGCTHASHLAIEEDEKRAEIMRTLVPKLLSCDQENACSHNVSVLMELANNTPDEAVRKACKRSAKSLIDGTLENTPGAIAKAFVHGDELNVAVGRAVAACNKNDFTSCIEVLTPCLKAIDKQGLYQDSDLIKWRYFNNYIDRALYNKQYEQVELQQTIRDVRLKALELKAPQLKNLSQSLDFPSLMNVDFSANDASGKGFGTRTVSAPTPSTTQELSLMLVPDAYYECLLGLSVAWAQLEHFDKALDYVARLIKIAPVDAQAHVQLIKCLMGLGHVKEAKAELYQYMEIAYAPEALALCYYQMSRIQIMENHKLAAEACLASAMHYMPHLSQIVQIEFPDGSTTDLKGFRDRLSKKELREILKTQDIPLAPTPEIKHFVYEGTKASIDAGLFGVARNFASFLGILASDDVVMGIIRSIEKDPNDTLI